jgi:hypothetical protein
MTASRAPGALSTPWPELPWRDWRPTIDTLHMWTQVVGKVRMALAAPLNHWWHTTLYVTSRGLTTSGIPYRNGQFQIDFDFIDHRLRVTDSDGGAFEMALEPRSVASFYGEFMAGLRDMGIDVRIWSRPVEVADAIRFEDDELHAAYDPDHARACWRGLVEADRVMKAYQSGFVGKASPVHFFWGSFDLATARYSGRPAPRHPGGAPNCPGWVMVEAYSREEVSVGWWPAGDEGGPMFYAYAYPEPPGYRSAAIEPSEATFDQRYGEFLLPYDSVRQAADPDAAALAFFQSVYKAGADLGKWDRAMLEPAIPPGRPPDRPWSLVDPRAPTESTDRPHRHHARRSRVRDR